MKSKSKSGLLFYSIAKKFQSLKEYIMEFIMIGIVMLLLFIFIKISVANKYLVII